MEQGRRRLERALGQTTFRNILAELRKDDYTDTDQAELARILCLQEYYQELRQREDVVHTDYSKLLLTRWALENPSRVSKENLSRIFKRTENLKNLAELLDYVTFPSLSCCKARSTSPPSSGPESPIEETSFFHTAESEPIVTPTTNLPTTTTPTLPFIHMNLPNGRQSAEEILADKPKCSYLVRPSSVPGNYAISIKIEDKVQHILIDTVLTGTGYKVTLNPLDSKYFPNLKALLDNYHMEELYSNYKLGSIILPQTSGKDELEKKRISDVFVERFSELVGNHSSLSLEQDIADRLGIGQLFKNYKHSFAGSNSSRRERARWILDLWRGWEGEKASQDKLEKSLAPLKEMKQIFKKLK